MKVGTFSLRSPIVFWAIVLFGPLLVAFLLGVVPFVISGVFKILAHVPYWLGIPLSYAAIFGPSLYLLASMDRPKRIRIAFIATFLCLMIVYLPLTSFAGLYACLLFNACP
jgi:hypothetical protein